MGLSSAAAIAFSAMQAQSKNLSETAEKIALADAPAPNWQSDSTSVNDADLAMQMVELTQEEHAYRASAAAFETGADLWDILNVVTRD